MSEQPSCYCHETPMARRAHQCCECRGEIKPGEIYHRHHGVWDGEGATYKVCADCEALKDDCDRGVGNYDDRTCFEGLRETVSGHWPYRKDYTARMVEIMTRRGARVPEWMAERVKEVTHE